MNEKHNLAAAAQDCMAYLPGMEVIESDILDEVQHAADSVDFNAFTERDVKAALMRKHKTVQDFAALLSPAALPFLEEMAQQARELTFKWFGAARSIFTPLYLANYCENYCVYCGFNCHNKINRLKLDEDGMEREMQAIAATDLREILLLTGESRSMSGVEYIASAVRLARKYFAVVGLEVYPLNSDEYAYLHECGADYVTVFQETYDVDAYAKLHLAGHKRVFPYRFYTQERALKGGMRGVAFAPLMGLSGFCRDIFACGLHAYLVQRKYPAAEISFSCPRLRPAEGNELPPEANGTDLRHLVQAVCAYRLFMPQAGITVSSREGAGVRDNLLQIAATKISAGVSTGIGTHSKQEREGDEQFEIDDNRSVDEVFNSIKKPAYSRCLRMAAMYKNFVCVTDRKISRAPFLQQIETICALRPKALILREKDLTEAEYMQLARKVQTVCKKYGVKFIVHTFWRAGLALGADGVHLPLPVCTAMTAAERLQAGHFGISVHSAEEARAALALGAAYLTAGHIYASRCKQGVPPRGLAFLKEICTLSPVPVYAIGGIGLSKAQLEEVLACGAAGACVRSAFMQL